MTARNAAAFVSSVLTLVACGGGAASQPPSTSDRPTCEVSFVTPPGFERTDTFEEPYPDRIGVRLGFRDEAGRELHAFAGIPGEFGEGLPDAGTVVLVGGGIGIAPLPFLSERLGGPPALLGFRSEWHAEAAALVPNAEVVIEPTYVTEAMPGGHDVLACGPEPMLEAVRELAPDAQLAWEAPMACGYGACYGCVVEVGGELKRLCVEGPVLAAA